MLVFFLFFFYMLILAHGRATNDHVEMGWMVRQPSAWELFVETDTGRSRSIKNVSSRNRIEKEKSDALFVYCLWKRAEQRLRLTRKTCETIAEQLASEFSFHALPPPRRTHSDIS